MGIREEPVMNPAKWRAYDCRNCGDKYRVHISQPHPENARVCPVCRTKYPDLNEQYYRAFGLEVPANDRPGRSFE